MASPVEFPGCNLLLGPPAGSDELKVRPMKVFSNGVCCVSCWELTAEERDEVARTGRVFISVMSGTTQPPVFVGGEDNVREVISDYGVWKR